jgi:hypothetical protein
MTELKQREALKAAGKQRLARYGMEQFLREIFFKVCSRFSRAGRSKSSTPRSM